MDKRTKIENGVKKVLCKCHTWRPLGEKRHCGQDLQKIWDTDQQQPAAKAVPAPLAAKTGSNRPTLRVQ